MILDIKQLLTEDAEIRIEYKKIGEKVRRENYIEELKLKHGKFYKNTNN